MRLPCVPSCALRELRAPLALVRNGRQRFLHSRTYDAAVIGGGITGLTAAYRLSKDPSCSKVTLYEKTPHLGGWLQSETIPVDGGEIVFEYGPRTLRVAVPSCLPLVDLIDELRLADQVVPTNKTSPAALNRYIYYPDHLVRAPTPTPRAGFFSNISSLLSTLLREPVFETFLWSLLYEPWKEPGKSQLAKRDESVADFVSRRLSPQVADNLVSALYHGIFAGDVSRLSAQALLGEFRDMESSELRVLASALQAANAGMIRVNVDDMLAIYYAPEEKPYHYWRTLSLLVRSASTITLKHGVGQLADALAEALKRSSGKVDILTSTDVTSISQGTQTSNVTIGFGNTSRTHDRVIATNPAPELAGQLSNVPKDAKTPHSTISSLREHNYAVTVMVVNLYYPNPDLLSVKGFGYLIPRSIPYEQNPERALGVIFASESGGTGQDTAPGTKLTVMMGGHWWDGWKESDYPDHDTAVKMARSLLERHLGITDTPTVTRSRLQRDAIPQPTVGHLERMNDISQSIRQDFNNRITLAGGWYGLRGSSVVDCVRQAYLAASYGVGAQKLNVDDHDSVLSKYNYRTWDLEGGIVAAPVRTVEVHKADVQHF
ncbi:hypothetical protein ARAM_003146 [Aspergillus rambellii]|uniref:Protoporphyrinogen oxidase n=1 Tax=Aspergillus rambellii TaxID=308745 RepID=A0A0F8XQV6_9EURO|nr:hypothetical protein ARAM_003146 [Aspergillus rambellii]